MIEFIKYKSEKKQPEYPDNQIHTDIIIRDQDISVSPRYISAKFFPYSEDPMSSTGQEGFMAYKSDYDKFVFSSILILGETREIAYSNYCLLKSNSYRVEFLDSPFLNPELYEYDVFSIDKLTVPDENTTRTFSQSEKDAALIAIQDYQRHFEKSLFGLSYDSAFYSYQLSEEHRANIKKTLRRKVANGEAVGRPKNARSYDQNAINILNVILNESIDFGGHTPDIDIMEKNMFSRTTYYKYKKELLEERKTLAHLSLEDFKEYEKRIISSKRKKN